MNLNKVYLIGRLASDPEFRTTPGGQEVASLRIATNRIWKDPSSGQRNESTEFHSVVTWGRLAQIANQYLNKGSLVMIEGRLQTRSWQGKDGLKRYRTEIVAENIQLGPKPKGGLAGEGTREAKAPQTEEGKPSAAKATEDKDEIPVVSEEEPPSVPSPEAGDIEEDEVNLKEMPF